MSFSELRKEKNETNFFSFIHIRFMKCPKKKKKIFFFLKKVKWCFNFTLQFITR